MELESTDAASTSVSSMESGDSDSGEKEQQQPQPSSALSNDGADTNAAAVAQPTVAAVPPPPQHASAEHSYADLEAWLAKLHQGTPLTEPEVKTLTELARERLLQESNVQPVPAPVTICGDIHGQWHDLMEVRTT